MYEYNLPPDYVAIETLDAYLAEQAHDRIDHLEAVLKTVADLLDANKTPANVEKAIAFIRSECNRSSTFIVESISESGEPKKGAING